MSGAPAPLSRPAVLIVDGRAFKHIERGAPEASRKLADVDVDVVFVAGLSIADSWERPSEMRLL